MNREARGAIAIVVSIVLVAFAGIALASDGGPHPGTWKTWHIGPDPIIVGFDPHETIEDVAALSGHVGRSPRRRDARAPSRGVLPS